MNLELEDTNRTEPHKRTAKPVPLDKAGQLYILTMDEYCLKKTLLTRQS